jgi:hypothetical protein
MHRTVNGNCQCGSNELVVVRELRDQEIQGYCPKCNQPFSGFYLMVPSSRPAAQKSEVENQPGP